MHSVLIDDGRTPAELGRKTARGAAVSFTGQAGNFALRFLWIIVIARLVTPEHFGLVGMVSAFTGLLSLFRDVGLSAVTVQLETVSNNQLSALFWINLLIGGVLALLTAAAAPLLAAFYGDQRLVDITLALAAIFFFYGAVAQHRALLQRRMQFAVLTLIDIGALIASIAVGVVLALAGLGYWALVGMMVGQPLATLLGVWWAAGWTPGPPRPATGIRSMLRFGGVVTLNGFVVYIAYNMDKVLLGRVFGPEVLGLYGRAYQLVSLPTENMHTTLNTVMFPALSRVQNDVTRMRNFFLKGYGLFLSVVLPVTAGCALFAEDIVAVLLGPNWGQVVPIFRLLTPTILAFALINPMSSLMLASGHAVRSLNIAFFIAPIVITGYLLGLSSGPEGVAFGFSAAMLLVIVPVLYWATKGTSITLRCIARAALPPSLSTVAGAGMSFFLGQTLTGALPVLRLAAEFATMFVVHFFVLAYCLGQRQVYVDLLHKVFGSGAGDGVVHPKG
jgi:O-antigen/teichoic acid export membrane protein